MLFWGILTGRAGRRRRAGGEYYGYCIGAVARFLTGDDIFAEFYVKEVPFCSIISAG